MFTHIHTASGSKAMCPVCKFDPDEYRSDFDVYYRTKTQHPEMPPQVTIGEPCMVNPNGKENVFKAIIHVKKYM